MNNNKIGLFLTNLREEKHLTQEQLGKELFIGREGISKWERGINIPSTEMLVKLSDFYNVSVNEILSGERKNNKNKEIIERISLDILNDKNRIVKKFKIIFLFIFALIFCLLFLFFLMNYNSINVYNIGFENDKYRLNEGMLLLSRDEFYFNLGDIESDNIITKIDLYVLKDQKKYMLFSVNGNSILYTNKFGEDQDFSYNDSKYVIDNLYLDIYDENDIYSVKLNYGLSYNNIRLFYDNNNNSIFERYNNEKNIPIFVKENFIFSSERNLYEYVENNYELTYDNILNFLKIFNKNDFIIYEYDIDSRIINIENNNDNYDYKIDEKCDNKLCNSDEFKYVYNHYITKFNL